MREPVRPGSRLVVKVGSSSLVAAEGGLNQSAVARVADQVASARAAGNPTVLVSSGAVAAGMATLGMPHRPLDVPTLQTMASVGQGLLMHRYTEALGRHGLVAGQVLLTLEVLSNRDQYLNARQALDRMLEAGVVPVVNENDAVVVDELKLGDNDRLAAIVSHLVSASLFVILTDTPGLYSADPSRNGSAEFLNAVDHADAILDGLSGSGPMGSGGVRTKVLAARMAAWSGIPTVVASATESLESILAGNDVGTWVKPRSTSLSARRLWIAFGQVSKGSVTVDDGARNALLDRGTSLLPVGILAVEGGFVDGDTIDVVGRDGRLVGRGLARQTCAALATVVGQRGGAPAIHRDDLVIFN